MTNIIFCWFLFTISVLTFVNGLSFHMGETEKKCFIEDLPEDTLLTGRYKLELWNEQTRSYIAAASSSGLGVLVDAANPFGESILHRLYSAEGRFTFSSRDAGEHVVCLHTNSSAWFGGSLKLRVNLEFITGESGNSDDTEKHQAKLTDLHLRIKQLLEQVHSVTKEQNYQRQREERFRHLSESTSSRVFWWSFVQVSALLLVGLWQARHLRSFFEAKKLV
jgi:hypothetical protein